MALVDYKKYQVFINSDSKKVQGLRTGDIIRRQYFDGTNTVYSLMCVLSYGVERIKNASTGLYDERSYFIAALLEGNELDCSNKNEIFDFARITSLFDVDRLGALYLTASDSNSPFMDVIDGIGRNKSLSWPNSLSSEGFEDSKTQYVVKGIGNLSQRYTDSSQDNSRVLTVTRMNAAGTGFEGLKQDFYQFIRSGNQVLISYKVRGSRAMFGVRASLGYSDDLHKDAEWSERITDSWEYKFHVVTVEYSGRHLRSFKFDMTTLEVSEEIQISDFNIILLSSIANFPDASATRVGKLDGVVDNVFGQLSGHGAYLQKLYASRSAHISGTLTAGDENGFGATFYAGKIHRNCFLNSLSPNFIGNVHIEGDDSEVINPTGIGSVYRSSSEVEAVAQTNEWMHDNIGERYCFSFWLYMKSPGKIVVSQNGKGVGEITISSDQTHEWRRVHSCFDVLTSDTDGESVLISLTPTFFASEYEIESQNETDSSAQVFYFTSPQLETGDAATQYQATDDILNATEEYGAWFNRGGIGGTMQNPLLQLNFKDEEGNEGGIGTRSKSLLLRQDGSGYLAQKNIVWNQEGDVTFGHGVTLNWENLSDAAKKEMGSRSCRIVGEDTFTIIGYGNSMSISPDAITLAIKETGFTSTSAQRQWLYKRGGEWCVIEDANAKTLVVAPDSDLWGMQTLEDGSKTGGESTLTFKCVITFDDGQAYSDTKSIHKQQVQGYMVEVVSSSGSTFQNGGCSTTLTANVYYQGSLVDLAYLKAHFSFTWRRYDISNYTELELNANSTEVNNLVLDYELDSSELYVCELSTIDVFDYSFTIIF